MEISYNAVDFHSLVNLVAADFFIITSVIRQKDESQNGGNKKTKQAKFSEKMTFL